MPVPMHAASAAGRQEKTASGRCLPVGRLDGERQFAADQPPAQRVSALKPSSSRSMSAGVIAPIVETRNSEADRPPWPA